MKRPVSWLISSRVSGAASVRSMGPIPPCTRKPAERGPVCGSLAARLRQPQQQTQLPGPTRSDHRDGAFLPSRCLLSETHVSEFVSNKFLTQREPWLHHYLKIIMMALIRIRQLLHLVDEYEQWRAIPGIGWHPARAGRQQRSYSCARASHCQDCSGKIARAHSGRERNRQRVGGEGGSCQQSLFQRSVCRRELCCALGKPGEKRIVRP